MIYSSLLQQKVISKYVKFFQMVKVVTRKSSVDFIKVIRLSDLILLLIDSSCFHSFRVDPVYWFVNAKVSAHFSPSLGHAHFTFQGSNASMSSTVFAAAMCCNTCRK